MIFSLLPAGYTDEHGDFPKSRQAFSVDALSTMFGALFGMSPVTSYVESASGVNAGARTGLTALFIGFYFFLSLFFAPIIASIPPWATGGALILVGSMMARSLKDIKWYDVSHAATAFVTVIVMPLTYSIAYGLIAGIFMWIILQATFWILGFLGVERPEFTEDDIPKGELSNVDMDDDSRVDKKENSSAEEQIEEAPVAPSGDQQAVEEKTQTRPY
jgi:adenine/guanine/hypoxanthine permease